MKRKTIKPIAGWVLIGREEEGGAFEKPRLGDWYICWHELFDRKRDAMKFARDNKWPPGYRAVRGGLIV